MRHLVIHPRGRVDLLEIWNHIAKDSIDVANRVSDEIDAAIRSLLEMPGKGHFRKDVKKRGYRFWTVYSYVIAYRFDDDSLTVVRVVHGQRSFKRLFRR
jgi:toxin ParE1/3/4